MLCIISAMIAVAAWSFSTQGTRSGRINCLLSDAEGMITIIMPVTMI